jgi:hypothetical protein
MKETIEIRNETDKPILASACRSKITGKLYVHIGRVHGLENFVEPKGYNVINVDEVEF